MKGYEQLGLLTAEFPELLILRRFDRLASRILLRMQAEILYLEQELDVFMEEDEKSDADVTRYWGKVRESASEGNPPTHLEKLTEVEEKLKTYRKPKYYATKSKS